MVQWRRLGEVLTKEAWPFWVSISVPVVAWPISFIAATSCQNQILYAGTCFQLAGVATVAYGVHRLRKTFLRPSADECRETWAMKLLKALHEPVSVKWMPDDGLVAQESDSYEVVTTCRPDLMCEERVEALEKALAGFQMAHAQQLTSIRDDILCAKELVHQECIARQKVDTELTSMIKTLAVGGIRLEVIGLIWLFLGTLGTCIPKVIASLIPSAFIQ